MPRIDDALISMVAYLYEDETFASDASEDGGTGFIVSTKCQSPELRGYRHLHIVTNKHVIEDYPVYKMPGRGAYIVEKPTWYTHPDGEDLAAAYFDCERFGQEGWHYHVPTDLIATEEKIKEFNIGIGDDLFWVGRFVALDEPDAHWPVARFGHISSMPRPILQAGTDHVQSFVFETWSYPGYSGAPVFVYRDEFPKIGRALLIGVNWGHTSDIEHDDPKEKLPEKYRKPADLNTGMMLAVPAWEIPKVLENEELKMQRDEKEKTLVEELNKQYKRRAGVMDSTKKSGELGTFKDFAEKIVSVPKSEIDRQGKKKNRKGSTDA